MISRLGHYDIVEELGRGGMGVVYKGYESSLGRYVAIKVLSATMAHDKVFVERFLREARAMAALNDAHIIQIYFIGQDEDQTFFVMEYIDGESLSTCLKRQGNLSVGDALKVLLHASQGLASAHAQGVIHRDIKPGNIMITSRGQVKVADFGIALANQDLSAKLTNTGAFVGTPGYLSPEVCMGKPVDQRSDIFALGIVLFESLTGRMPFHDDSPLKLMLDVVQAPTPDVRESNPEVDAETARILEKMLEKDPAARYQSCDELNIDLKQHPAVRDGGALSIRPAPWAGANASNPTVVGMPTPATPGLSPRAATPPPVVTSRTAGAATPASGTFTGRAAPTPPPPAAASAPSPWRGVTLGLLLLGVAGLGWAFATGKLSGGPDPVAPAPVVAAPAATPPVPPAAPVPTVAAPTGMAGASGDEAMAMADAEQLAQDAQAASDDPSAAGATGDGEAKATVAYFGHGGPNGERNRVRAKFVREPSPAELLAREQARQQAELDAAAAAAAAAAPLEPLPTATAPAQQAKVKKTFRCRVFKICDDNKRPARRGTQPPANEPATAQDPAPAPETPAGSSAGN
jgi:predicted Ser/Thr protein kinase